MSFAHTDKDCTICTPRFDNKLAVKQCGLMNSGLRMKLQVDRLADGPDGTHRYAHFINENVLAVDEKKSFAMCIAYGRSLRVVKVKAEAPVVQAKTETPVKPSVSLKAITDQVEKEPLRKVQASSEARVYPNMPELESVVAHKPPPTEKPASPHHPCAHFLAWTAKQAVRVVVSTVVIYLGAVIIMSLSPTMYSNWCGVTHGKMQTINNEQCATSVTKYQSSCAPSTCAWYNPICVAASAAQAASNYVNSVDCEKVETAKIVACASTTPELFEVASICLAPIYTKVVEFFATQLWNFQAAAIGFTKTISTIYLGVQWATPAGYGIITTACATVWLVAGPVVRPVLGFAKGVVTPAVTWVVTSPVVSGFVMWLLPRKTGMTTTGLRFVNKMGHLTPVN